jgi:hypothetical protein
MITAILFLSCKDKLTKELNSKWKLRIPTKHHNTHFIQWQSRMQTDPSRKIWKLWKKNSQKIFNHNKFTYYGWLEIPGKLWQTRITIRCQQNRENFGLFSFYTNLILGELQCWNVLPNAAEISQDSGHFWTSVPRRTSRTDGDVGPFEQYLDPTFYPSPHRLDLEETRLITRTVKLAWQQIWCPPQSRCGIGARKTFIFHEVNNNEAQAIFRVWGCLIKRPIGLLEINT